MRGVTTCAIEILDELGLQEAQGRNVWSVFICFCEAVATILLTAISNISPYSNLHRPFLLFATGLNVPNRAPKMQKDDGKYYDKELGWNGSWG